MTRKKISGGLRRRQLLAWSVPTVTVVTIPTHALTSPCGCGGPPVLSVSTPSKCAGDPPVGTAVIKIAGPDKCAMLIKSMEFETENDKNSLENMPAFPFFVSDTESETITWIGPASDAIACLPLGAISLTIKYCCEDGKVLTHTYDLTRLLAEAVL